MQVRTGRESGRANLADDLPSSNLDSLPDAQLREVKVKRLYALAVIDSYGATLTGKHAGDPNDSIISGPDGPAFGGSHIQTSVIAAAGPAIMETLNTER